MIDPVLAAVLACPRCDHRPPLRYEPETLVCDVCQGRYPVVDGIVDFLCERDIAPTDAEQEVNRAR